MEMPVRLFLALFPTAVVQSAAYRASEAWRNTARGRGVAWVKRENLHWTLRFLGEQDEEGCHRAEEAAREAAARHAAFEVRLGSPGAFPNARRARVLWLGLAQGSDAMRALAQSLERALGSRGFGPADQPFAPHLTIGRVRDRNVDWSEALASCAVEPIGGPVCELCLVRSTLRAGGSSYEPLARVPLGSVRAQE